MAEVLLPDFDMTLPVWLGCAATLALGAFVQRATGFGLAVVGAPLLLMLEPRLVPVVLVLFGFTVALATLRHYWREVRLAEIGTALVGRIPGNALGLWLLMAAPMAVLEKLIAGSRSEEHTSELQSRPHLVCRLLLEKKKETQSRRQTTCPSGPPQPALPCGCARHAGGRRARFPRGEQR